VSFTAIAYNGKLSIAAQADSSWMSPTEVENWLLKTKLCINEMAAAQTLGDKNEFSV